MNIYAKIQVFSGAKSLFYILVFFIIILLLLLLYNKKQLFLSS